MSQEIFFSNVVETLISLMNSNGNVDSFIEAVGRDARSGETVADKVNFILNAKCAAQGHIEANQSKGHKANIGKFEYFTSPAGDLYRAPLANPIMTDGYRGGARWEAPVHMAESWLERAVQNA